MTTEHQPEQSHSTDHDDDDDARWLTQIGEATHVVDEQRRKLPGYALAWTSVRMAILAAAVACVYIMYHLPTDSYAQSLAANAAAGFAVFYFAAPLLRAMRSRPWTTLGSGVVVVVLILYAALVTSSVTQALLLNAGIGLALLLALDLNIARWLDAITAAEGNTRKRIAEAAKLVEQAQSVLDYKYAVHDYLNLPRPDQLGGIRLPEGETFMGALGWPDQSTDDEH